MTNFLKFVIAVVCATTIVQAHANIITVTTNGTVSSGFDTAFLYGGGDLTGKSFQSIVTYDTGALSLTDYSLLDISSLSGSGTSINYSIYTSVDGVGGTATAASGLINALNQTLTLGNGASTHNALLPIDQVYTSTSGSAFTTPFELFPGSGLGPDHIEYNASASISSFASLLSGRNFTDSFTVTKGLSDISVGSFGLTYQGVPIMNISLNPQTIAFNSIPTPVPEPDTYAMLLAGLGVMTAVVLRRKQKQA